MRGVRSSVRRVRRRLILAVAATLLTPAAASAAAVYPGTAEFAVPARGTVAVAPGLSSPGVAYLPFTGPRTFTVFARLRAPVVRRPMTLLVRHTSARAACAPSYSADRGTPLRLGVGVPDAAGRLTLTSREIRWTRTGARRFCAWLTTNPRTRVRPASSVVRFARRATGGVQFARRDADGTTGIETYVASTDPYSLAASDAGCPPSRTRDYGLLSRPGAYGLIEFTSFDYSPSGCTRSVTIAVNGSTAGAFALTTDVPRAAAGAVNQAGGVCTLPNTGETVPDARALVVAQGCRVGRELTSPRSSSDPGRVWAYVVNGARAWLVPRGTRVDLAVNPPR